jgi:GNAT superfamily N-acetyltransferase
MINPAHQRRGIGAKLLSAVLAKSDAEKLPTFLTSSMEAHPLYTKLGFVDFGPDFRIDNEDWARRIMELEEQLGVDESRRLKDRCVGLYEVENCMVRWAQ